MDIAVNFLGLVGVLLLAGPAFYAAKYGRLAARARASGPIDPKNAELVKIHENALLGLSEHQSSWTPALSRCLIGGTLCAGFSYVLALMKAWHELGGFSYVLGLMTALHDFCAH
jgi:hypothetical protein